MKTNYTPKPGQRVRIVECNCFPNVFNGFHQHMEGTYSEGVVMGSDWVCKNATKVEPVRGRPKGSKNKPDLFYSKSEAEWEFEDVQLPRTKALQRYLDSIVIEKDGYKITVKVEKTGGENK